VLLIGDAATSVPSNCAGTRIFSDVAWNQHQDGLPTPAVLGIFIQLNGNLSCSQLYISAVSPSVASPLQAEAHGLLLAVRLGCVVLTKAVAFNNILTSPRHWELRPQLAAILNSGTFIPNNAHHISRSFNFKAHFQDRLAVKIQDRAFSFRCLANPGMNVICSFIDGLSSECVAPCTLLYVKCC